MPHRPPGPRYDDPRYDPAARAARLIRAAAGEPRLRKQRKRSARLRRADRTVPLVAYRSWVVDAFARLRAVTYADEVWAERAATRARCAQENGHAAPAHDCSCGLYARFDPASAETPRSDAVVGAVAMWGRVETHRDGARAEYARPVALVLPDDATSDLRDVLDRVAARYDVPLVPPADLEFEALRWGDPITPDLLPDPPRDHSLESWTGTFTFRSLWSASSSTVQCYRASFSPSVPGALSVEPGDQVTIQYVIRYPGDTRTFTPRPSPPLPSWPST